MTGSHVFTVPAEEWRVVDGELHTHGWFVDSDRGQCFRILEVGDGITDLESLDPDKCADFSTLYLVNFLFSHAFEGH